MKQTTLDDFTYYTEMANLKELAYRLFIPTVPGFVDRTKEQDNPRVILMATDGSGLAQTLTSDGMLEEDEMFAEHLDSVLVDSQEVLNTMGPLNDNNIVYIKSVKNVFNFKIYLQDTIVDNQMIRQFNAYFMEREDRVFYTMSIAAGPLPYPNPDMTVGCLDKEIQTNDGTVKRRDPLTSLMLSVMELIVLNIDYK